MSDERWPGMTAKDLRRVGKYVRRCADQLGLRDWTVHLAHEPLHADSGTAASIDVVTGRRHAHMKLSRNWWTYDQPEQRELIVHELLHVHFDPIEEPFRHPTAGPGAIWKLLGDSTGDVVLSQLHLDIERAVAHLAEVIAPSFPLPKERG